jgi:hypothetical protein
MKTAPTPPFPSSTLWSCNTSCSPPPGVSSRQIRSSLCSLSAELSGVIIGVVFSVQHLSVQIHQNFRHLCATASFGAPSPTSTHPSGGAPPSSDDPYGELSALHATSGTPPWSLVPSPLPPSVAAAPTNFPSIVEVPSPSGATSKTQISDPSAWTLEIPLTNKLSCLLRLHLRLRLHQLLPLHRDPRRRLHQWD